MTTIEVFLGVLFAPTVLGVGGLILPREGSRGGLETRLFWAILLFLMFGLIWLTIDDSRTLLLVLAVLIAPGHALREGPLRRLLQDIGFAELFVLIPLALICALTLPRTSTTWLSPDGRWEVRRSEQDYDGVLYLVPRGLSTLDPRAYPARVLVGFDSDATPGRVLWTGPREITVRWTNSRPQSRRIQNGLGLRIVIER